MSKARILGFKELFPIAAIIATLSIAMLPKTALAGDDSNSGTSYYASLSCGQLWYARNQIFASRGHCFTTARGQRTFPNSCFAPYGKLPGNLKRTVRTIKKWERRRGC